MRLKNYVINQFISFVQAKNSFHTTRWSNVRICLTFVGQTVIKLTFSSKYHQMFTEMTVTHNSKPSVMIHMLFTSVPEVSSFTLFLEWPTHTHANIKSSLLNSLARQHPRILYSYVAAHWLLQPRFQFHAVFLPALLSRTLLSILSCHKRKNQIVQYTIWQTGGEKGGTQGWQQPKTTIFQCGLTVIV